MRLLIAGGGTGGHLYPGIAVARAWLKQGPDHKVLFVGTRHGIEARVLPREGLPFEPIAAGGVLGRSPGQQIVALAKMAWGVVQSLGLLGRYRPHVVLGVGGYASAPAVVASWLRRRPVVLLEQNTIPGVANRLLGRLALRVAIAFPAAAPYFDREKVRGTGLPLRENIARPGERPADFWEGPLRVLIFGGSQGAHAINQAMTGALPLLGGLAGRLRFVHQTGEADFEAVRAAYDAAGAEAEVAPFFYDMPERYGWAHLAISRAGAMTVGELGASALPAVLIPLPTAIHGHQEANARYLVDMGAARMILQPELTAEVLAGCLRELEADRGALAEMARKAGEMATGDASGAVADLCREVARAA